MRKRPGRKPVFTRRQVIDAALAEGIGSFTLRAVAERLGVKATALYRVFSSRQELQLAAMNAISRDIEPDPRLRTWQEALRDVVNRYWDMCSRYPEAATVILTQPEAFGMALPRIAAIVERLAELGIPAGTDGAALALDFVVDMTLETYVSIQPYLTPDANGRTGLDRLTQILGGRPDLFGMQDLGERGNLDLKVEFIIAGMERGLFPGTPSQGRSLS